MMTHAYNELYLHDAKENLGQFFDYMINNCGLTPDTAANIFVSTGIASQFEIGNPAYISGKSGIEIAKISLDRLSYKKILKPTFTTDRSPEYWSGWSLADYQWRSGIKFSKIFSKVRFSEIISMYPVFHECDILTFVNSMNKKINKDIDKNSLKTIRKKMGMSQKDLSLRSGINIRSIRLYEQQYGSINKAEVQTIYYLSKTLNCSIEDILER